MAFPTKPSISEGALQASQASSQENLHTWVLASAESKSKISFFSLFAFDQDGMNHQGSSTKRSKKSITAVLFEPVGNLGPVIVVAKTIFQPLWKEELRWDQSVPEEFSGRWSAFIRGLLAVRKIKIPRRVRNGASLVGGQMHVFGDASRTLYARVNLRFL